MKTSITTAGGSVSADIEGAGGTTTLVLAHGAGAGMDHPFMQTVASRLALGGLTVVRFNFLYIEVGRKTPDRRPVLEETFAAAVKHVEAELAPSHLFLGGKSMGGRIASYLPRHEVRCDGLVFLGYPLHPPGRPDRIRDSHLYQLRVPMLFVEGTRDPFCPLETLAKVRTKLPGSDLVVIDDGDHSFRVRKSSGRDSDAALQEVCDAVLRWVEKVSV